MNIYYKAEICISHETYLRNDKSEGIDPNSWQDVGLETLKHHSLAGLFEKLRAFTGSSIERDDCDETNRYISWAEVTDRDGTEILITYDIRLFKVTETDLDLD